MVGSSQSMAGPNIYINGAVAQVLKEAADRLESAEDVELECHALIRDFYQNHKRIIFNGNGYSKEWKEEALRRGLPNFPDTVSALPGMVDDKSIALFEEQGILSRFEVASRMEIYLQTYSKQINIEASVMVEMCRKQIIPSVSRYLGVLVDSITKQSSIGLETSLQKEQAAKLNEALERAIEATEKLHIALAEALSHNDDALLQAQQYRDEVGKRMATLRQFVDVMETFTDKAFWPLPSYDDLLFRL